MNEFVSEQKQALSFPRLDPAFDFVGAAVTEETGDISLRGCRLAATHKQFEHVLTDHFLLFQTGILFAQAIKTLNIAVLIENYNDGIRFRNHLFREGESLSEIACYGGGIVPGRCRAGPLVSGDFAADKMHGNLFAIQGEVH